MKLVLALALVFCVQVTGFAQVKAKPAEFEAATVKLAAPATSQPTDETKSTSVGSVNVTPEQASYEGVTLKRLMMTAYDLKPFQISGPAWLETEHYDVAATIPKGTPKEQISVMLQHLLANRFQITQHTETKDEPIYILRIGNTGPKLKPSSSDHPQTTTGFKLSTTGIATDQAEMKFVGETMADFANSLSGRLDHPVIDQTGLAGRFDIMLPMDAKDLQPDSTSLAASLISGVHTVGLKLDPGKAPMKHLVVDKAEKIPTEN